MNSSRYRQWFDHLYSPSVRKSPERKAAFVTSSDVTLKPLYTAEDVPAHHHESMAGEAPFMRGVTASMYRSKLWTMRQYAGFGDAYESNQRYHYLLAKGQTGLSVAFDLPTQMGFDSDSPRALGEVGKVGVAIDSIEDMETLLKDLPLETISTSMTINSTAAILLSLYLAVADRRGIARTALQGTVQNDILKEYIARGTYIYPPAPSMRIITDLFAFCAKEVPKWNTISISGYHIREAGSTAAQEIAFTLANAIAYVEAALKAGLAVDDFAPRLSFFFNVHNNFLEEIAKFRAARTLWAQIMQTRFHTTQPRSLALRFHAQTAGSTLTAQQPDNNVTRVTLQALAAVLGGCQSLHTNSRDEALGLPTESSAQIALRTQQIIAHESGVADIVDPLGGSYALEALTDALMTQAKIYIEKIDNLGGAVRAIEQQYQSHEIEEAAYQYQRAIEEKRAIIVGLNDFKVENEAPPTLLTLDPEVERKQRARLHALKSGRSQSAVNQALGALVSTAQGEGNLMPAILHAVQNYVTLGEISDALRQVFGEYR